MRDTYIHNLKLLCCLLSHFFSVSTIHTDNKVTIFHNQLNVDGITRCTKRYMHWQVKIEFLIINALEKVILRTGLRCRPFYKDSKKIYILMRLFSNAWFAVFSGYPPPSPDDNNNILLNRCYPSTNITMGTSEYPSDGIQRKNTYSFWISRIHSYIFILFISCNWDFCMPIGYI